MTIFEKIAAREIPAKIVHETDEFFAFQDVNPQAPVHVLIVPKKAIPRLAEAGAGDAELLGRMLVASREVAQKLGVLESGYRLVINNGRDGGETVPPPAHASPGRAAFRVASRIAFHALSSSYHHRQPPLSGPNRGSRPQT
ncbi:MAG: histidine triad nucleotide-binding protein [Chthoniobacter sp.]